MRCLQFSVPRTIAGALFLLVLSSCVATPQSDRLLDSRQPASDSSVLLDEVPFFPQERYQCGPAAIATVLRFSDVPGVTAESMVSRVYLPGRQGSLQVEMLAAARQSGRIPYVIPGRLDAVLDEVRAGRPVLVFQNLGLSMLPQWHYAVVVGYDPEARELILRSGTERTLRTRLRVFERTWARADHWAMVVLRPGELPVEAEPLAYIEAVTAFAGAGNGQSVGPAYAEGARRWPQEPLVQISHANHLYGDGQYERAAEVLEDLLAHHPDIPDAHNNLAHALLRMGRPRAALPHAERAVSLGGTRLSTYRQTLDTVQSMLQETGDR